jgi:hypothetical protein
MESGNRDFPDEGLGRSSTSPGIVSCEGVVAGGDVCGWRVEYAHNPETLYNRPGTMGQQKALAPDRVVQELRVRDIKANTRRAG